MTSYQRYKRNVLVKALVIPAITALIFSGVLLVSLPRIQNALPNGAEYSVQTGEVIAHE